MFSLTIGEKARSVTYGTGAVPLRSAHTRGQVPATSPCNKSLGQVPSCELATFPSDESLVPATGPTNSNQFEFWDKSRRLVPQNVSCELFVGLVPATSPFV